MILGANESVAGGLHRAFERGRADGCRALQIFTTSSRQWAQRPLAAEEIEAFRREAGRSRWPLMAHASYLINLGTGDDGLRRRSCETLYGEVVRAETLGLDFLVLHPGAHGGDGEEVGLNRVAECMGAVLERTRGARVRLLVELTAGQGSCLGHRFEHLRALLDRTPGANRMGVCFDTCHAVAAGYDLRDDYDGVWREFDQVVGLDRLYAFHLNDSKKPLGCRVDRHTNPGDGVLGERTFQRLLRDRRFAGMPAVLETPPLPGGEPSFRANLERLRRLL